MWGKETRICKINVFLLTFKYNNQLVIYLIDNENNLGQALTSPKMCGIINIKLNYVFSYQSRISIMEFNPNVEGLSVLFLKREHFVH